MAIISGREYGIGEHIIDGNIIQVIDNSTYRTIGKENAPKPERDSETVRFARININSADAETLAELDGVSLATARRIVKARPFDEVDDLVSVKGIGQRVVDNNRDRVVA